MSQLTDTCTFHQRTDRSLVDSSWSVPSMSLEAHSQLSSNYRKHTAANPLQRALIDRFHRKIVSEVLALSPESFLDAGCGEGFVARRLIDSAPDIDVTGCDVSEGAL